MNSGRSSSSGTSNANYNPTNSTTTPYGNATPTNYSWQSFLPESGTASAQLGDASAQRYSDGSTVPTATSTPLTTAADATATTTDSASGGLSTGMRKALAEIMAAQELKKYLGYVNKESAGSGSQSMGSFGSGGNTGTKGGGLY